MSKRYQQVTDPAITTAPGTRAPAARTRSRTAGVLSAVALVLCISAAVSPVIDVASARTVQGGPAADTVRGSHAKDRLLGGGGDDRLWAFRGNDYLNGQEGRDTYFAGPGNDVIDARDGVNESILCGPGRDSVSADPGDATVGCERVSRPSAPATPAAPAAPAAAASAAPAPSSQPRYAIASPQWQYFQTDGDWCNDAAFLDSDGNGLAEDIWLDADEGCDGFDTRIMNTVGFDNFLEAITYDFDENGVPESWLLDIDQAVGFEYLYFDDNQDGYSDRVQALATAPTTPFSANPPNRVPLRGAPGSAAAWWTEWASRTIPAPLALTRPIPLPR